MYTQCPECQTIFEIDEEALQASLGIVHCGRCSKRFDALRTLSGSLPVEPMAKLPEQDPAQHVPTLTEAVSPEVLESAARKRHRGRPAKAPSVAASGSASLASGTPESTIAVPGAAGHAADAFDDLFASDLTAQLIAAANLDPEIDHDIDGWRVIDLADAEHATVVPVAPSLPADTDAQAESATALPAAPATTASPQAPAQIVAAAAEGEPSVAVEAADRDVPPADLPDAPAAAIGDADESATVAAVAPAVAPVYVPPPRRRAARATVAWAVGCVVFALLLAAQLAWLDRVQLYLAPATHVWVVRACQVIDCKLPPIKDTAQLEPLSRDVRPDPAVPGALTITATLRNDAAFRQPWPIVVVTLTDIDGRPVAMRRFRPAEYMPDPARRAAGIAPGMTAALAFEVADPGKRATGFRFGFE